MFNNKSLDKKFKHKNNNNNKKKYNSDDDEKPEGGNRKKRRLNKFKNNKEKNKNNNNNNNKIFQLNKPDNEDQITGKGKLKTYIDEKGRKKYDLSGINIADYENKNMTLGLNEEKKLLKFPHADERTFLKGRNEDDIIDVNKIIGHTFSLGKIETNLNQKNKKIIDDKINALGVIQVPQEKDLHKGDVFFCKTCECVLKDNAAYIEHLNGKKRKFFFF
jgi:hypothetical protein